MTTPSQPTSYNDIKRLAGEALTEVKNSPTLSARLTTLETAYDTSTEATAGRLKEHTGQLKEHAEALKETNRRVPGPFTIYLDFRFTPPQRPRYRNANGEGIHAVKPDVDKLTRAVLDSLTAADIIDDDARCITLTATKNYTTKLHPSPGVRIIIEPTND